MLAMTTDYRDVFVPTEPAYSAAYSWGTVGVAFVIAALAIVFWMVCGLPGVPATLSNKKYQKVVAVSTWILFTVMAGALVGGIMNAINLTDYNIKTTQVENNMRHNIQEKYDARLQGLGTVLNERFKSEALDQPQKFTLIFTPESDPNPVTKVYEIRFDRETSEPFISEVGGIVAPTAEQLEESAAKK